MDDLANRLADGVVREFERRMVEEYVPRIGRCVAMLSEAQVWQRPGPGCNSVANLLLHLEGNVRQWILSGLGGATDHRHRDAEFAAEAGAAGMPHPSEMVARLEATVREAAAVVRGLQPEQLLQRVDFQGGLYTDTALAGVLHVLEHFSGHAGQIYAWTKQLTGEDLRFYDL